MTDSRVITVAPLRWMVFAAGWLAVALGAIGIVVPGLPTTIFMIIGAACFARSSPRFERWLLDLPGVGPQVRAYREGRGMPRRAKIAAIAMMLTAVTISVLVIEPIAVRALVLAVAAIGVWFVGWHVPTAELSPSAS